jgi:hypothetical protein
VRSFTTIDQNDAMQPIEGQVADFHHLAAGFRQDASSFEGAGQSATADRIRDAATAVDAYATAYTKDPTLQSPMPVLRAHLGVTDAFSLVPIHCSSTA